MIKGITVLLLALVIFTNQSAHGQAFYNVMDFGATNDSTGINTKAIAKAIDAAAEKGGGTVYFPAGKYITGPIHFKSNITLFIDGGAELHFSDNFDHYLPMVKSRWEGTEVTNFSPLIYGDGLENIAIIGRGLIDGHGKKWWGHSEVTIRNQKEGEETKWQKEFKRLNKDVLAPDLPGWVERGFLRPPFIQFLNCNNIQIKDIKIQNSPFWTVNPQYCNNVTVDGVTIDNPPSPNTDGINPESCSNVRIANCYISVGDDCITIKSGKDRSGRKVNIPAENYTITNCTMLRGHGGVVIGSEMSGGVKNIVISNCVFDGTDRGIRLKTARGRGGVVENIRVSNIVMRNIRDHAIVLNMQYAKTDKEPVSERTPLFKDVYISDMAGSSNSVALILGLEEMPVENVSFTNINMKAKGGFEIENAKRLTFNNVQLEISGEPFMKAKNVEQLYITGIQNFTPLSDRPLLLFNNVKEANIQQNFPVRGTKDFLTLEGAGNQDIYLHSNNFSNVSRILSGPSEGVRLMNNVNVKK